MQEGEFWDVDFQFQKSLDWEIGLITEITLVGVCKHHQEMNPNRKVDGGRKRKEIIG